MVEVDKPRTVIPVRGVLSVIGAFLIQLMLGSFYTFGNIMPYLASYMRYTSETDSDVTYGLVLS